MQASTSNLCGSHTFLIDCILRGKSHTPFWVYLLYLSKEIVLLSWFQSKKKKNHSADILEQQTSPGKFCKALARLSLSVCANSGSDKEKPALQGRRRLRGPENNAFLVGEEIQRKKSKQLRQCHSCSALIALCPFPLILAKLEKSAVIEINRHTKFATYKHAQSNTSTLEWLVHLCYSSWCIANVLNTNINIQYSKTNAVHHMVLYLVHCSSVCKYIWPLQNVNVF